MMRAIDRMVIRAAKPVPPEELRDANAQTLREQKNAHYIHLARFMANCGANSVADLKASEKREYDRRIKAARAITAGTAPTLNLNAARMRLLNRSSNV